MAEHPSRGLSYFKEEMMEGIGWGHPYERGRHGFVTFYFPQFISFSHFLFVYFLCFCFILFLTAINL
jgi:hypothetical protein